MTDTRAGQIKVAEVVLVYGVHYNQFVAAGDRWLTIAEIRDTLPDEDCGVDADGDPLTCTRFTMRDGKIIRTAAALADVQGLMETGLADVATATFQPLVDQLEERNPEP